MEISNPNPLPLAGGPDDASARDRLRIPIAKRRRTMIATHFGLRVNPFPALSDPDSIFESSELIEVVQHFAFARENRDAILLITGEVGTGKTTAIRAIRRNLPDGNPVAVLSFGVLSPEELLGELEDGFRVRPRKGDTRARRLRRLQARFEKSCRAGHWPVLIVDEAHLLPDETLDEIRLLTNFRLGGQPTIQICLFGQSELAERLKQPRMRPLRQRISLRYEMRPLRPEGTLAYLHDRIRESGGDAPATVMTPAAARTIHELSGGIPREINVVASQAMMNAYVEGARTVQESHAATVSEHFAYEGAVRRESYAERPPEPTGVAEVDEDERAAEVPAPFPAVGGGREGRRNGLRPAQRHAAAGRLRHPRDRAHRRRAGSGGGRRPHRPERRGTGRAARPPRVLTGRSDDRPPAGVRRAARGAAHRRRRPHGRDPRRPPETDPDLGRTTPWSPAPRTTAADTATPTTLAERYPGRLDVQSPEPAVVWLDDRRLGDAPAIFSGLSPGRYALRIETRDGRSYLDEVQILLGSTTFVTPTFR